jgi:glycosyltransferase involved in cell wall biosynthesis
MKKKIKIVWVIDSLGHGGAEKLTLEIMKRFDRNEFDLRVCVLQEKSGNPIEKELNRIHIPVDMVHIPYLSHPSNLFKLFRYIQSQRPDIIHTQLQFADILGNIVAAMLKIPSFSTLHTLEDLSPRDGRAYWREKLTWTCLNVFCSNIIAVSDSARLFYLKKWGASHKKMMTIYNGIDLSNFDILNEEEKRNIKKSLNLPADGLVFTTVAVLREPKGIQYMLNAMPEILKKNQNFYYLIVGDGEYAQPLKHLSKSLRLENHVVFAGQRKDVNHILSMSDAFILPSLTEALPTVLIEAMASKKAVIATKVGGIPEMITEQVNGFIVSPADIEALAQACIKLAQDPLRRIEMGKQGYVIAQKKFDINQLIKTLSDKYKEAARNERK